MGSTYLWDLAEDLLAAAAASVHASRTGHPAPDRQFVSHNTPVVDACAGDGQLTVHLVDIDLNLVRQKGRGLMPGACHVSPVARYQVQLWRCVATLTGNGNVPTVGEMSDSAEGLAIDAWCLITGLVNAIAANALSDDSVEMGNLIPLGPQGGAGGWRIDLLYSLNDRGPEVVLDLSAAAVGST